KDERDRLRRELRLLDAAERALAASQRAEGGPGADPADVASDLAEEELDASLSAAGRDRLADVEAALLRAAEGASGDCLACGQPIGRARLSALPWTAYCRRCAGRLGAGQSPAPARAGLVAHMR